MGTELIKFNGVTKRFGDRTILDGVDLDIYEGQVTTIIGKSGTGKSVLLKHVIGLLSPDEGTILFRGIPVNGMKRAEWDAYRSQISYMFQNNALFDSMTVFENIALPLQQTTKLSRGEIEKKVLTRIEQTELTEVTYSYPAELSGGMQKRVALARALVTDPKIVLFDEPTTGQDPIRKNVILSMIAQYKKKFDFTAVVISHEIPDVFFISDRIVLLWEGKIGFQGTYDDASRLEHPMMEEFLKSLEGLQDELTGLLSKQMFRARYEETLKRKLAEKTITAILFSVELDMLCENLGHKAALEVIQSLGECINKELGALGGFSARHSRDQILTVLPHVNLKEAEQMLTSFSEGLQKRQLHDIHEKAQAEVCQDTDFEIYILAGITEARSNDEIDSIVEKARSKQKVIARYQYENRG
jgi:phospholipid/cholesterol/gamma-HCH transport system ATP-binding protein